MSIKIQIWDTVLLFSLFRQVSNPLSPSLAHITKVQSLPSWFSTLQSVIAFKIWTNGYSKSRTTLMKRYKRLLLEINSTWKRSKDDNNIVDKSVRKRLRNSHPQTDLPITKHQLRVATKLKTCSSQLLKELSKWFKADKSMLNPKQ